MFYLLTYLDHTESQKVEADSTLLDLLFIEFLLLFYLWLATVANILNRPVHGDHQDALVRGRRRSSRTWNRRGWESSTLETDVYVWRYALLEVQGRNGWMNESRGLPEHPQWNSFLSPFWTVWGRRR